MGRERKKTRAGRVVAWAFWQSVPNPAFPFTGNSSGVKNLPDFWHHFVPGHLAQSLISSSSRSVVPAKQTQSPVCCVQPRTVDHAQSDHLDARPKGQKDFSGRFFWNWLFLSLWRFLRRFGGF